MAPEEVIKLAPESQWWEQFLEIIILSHFIIFNVFLEIFEEWSFNPEFERVEREFYRYSFTEIWSVKRIFTS